MENYTEIKLIFYDHFPITLWYKNYTIKTILAPRKIIKKISQIVHLHVFFHQIIEYKIHLPILILLE